MRLHFAVRSTPPLPPRSGFVQPARQPDRRAAAPLGIRPATRAGGRLRATLELPRWLYPHEATYLPCHRGIHRLAGVQPISTAPSDAGGDAYARPRTIGPTSGNCGITNLQLRWKDILFADDFLCRGHFLLEELPRREDGWKQRWHSVREAVVQIAQPKSRSRTVVGSNPQVEGSAEQRSRCSVPVALRAPAPPHLQR